MEREKQISFRDRRNEKPHSVVPALEDGEKRKRGKQEKTIVMKGLQRSVFQRPSFQHQA